METENEGMEEEEEEILENRRKDVGGRDLQTNPSHNESMEDEIDSDDYSIVGDNIDKFVRPRYMRVGTGNEQLHYFHYFAVADRVDASNLSSTPPKPPSSAPCECALSMLPSVNDDKAMKCNFVTLVSRVISTHLESIGFDSSELVDWHIPHEYKKQMSKKSEVVCINGRSAHIL